VNGGGAAGLRPRQGQPGTRSVNLNAQAIQLGARPGGPGPGDLPVVVFKFRSRPSVTGRWVTVPGRSAVPGLDRTGLARGAVPVAGPRAGGSESHGLLSELDSDSEVTVDFELKLNFTLG
jgi:hypothetical protein